MRTQPDDRVKGNRRPRNGAVPFSVVPDLEHERSAHRRGFRYVAGLDEVGRGCLAGPVVAAAVIFPFAMTEIPPTLSGVRDSKQLTPEKREPLAEAIREFAVAYAVGCVEADEIDAIGIAVATRRAMSLAVQQLIPAPDCLLIDYLTLPDVRLPQNGIVGGDAICFSVAAASIVAKVWRDELMRYRDSKHPGYGFAQHKGYGTSAHLAALSRLGPCQLHRRSFRPVSGLTVADDSEVADADEC